MDTKNQININPPIIVCSDILNNKLNIQEEINNFSDNSTCKDIVKIFILKNSNFINS